MPAAKFEITRQCKVCGETFVAKTIESWYCSPKCSKIAWKRRKDEELRLQRLDDVVKKIPKSKEYITVPEAYALFGISKETLYRLIRKGTIPSVNAGERQTLLSKEELMKLYSLRKKALTKPKPIAKLYSLEPKDCYTIGKITEKFLVNESTVYLHIRKYNPQIQISAESETKRSIFREKDKTKRSKKESAQHSKSRNKSFVMTSVSAL